MGNCATWSMNAVNAQMERIGVNSKTGAASTQPLDADAFPDLTRFFAPRSVALLGATEDLSKFGGRCIRQMTNFGYAGTIYPINPKRETVFGFKCYPSVSALPETPDHVGIVLPAQAVPGALEQCVALDVPFATVFSSGFGETGTDEGRRLQKRIVEIARAGGIRVMGPNCNGLINFVDAFALTSTATINGPRRPAGDIGIVSQSGGAGQINVMWRAHQAGLGISHEVSCGNAADIDLLDYAAYMVEAPGTKVVLILAEQIANGAKLRALAGRAAELDKPLIMVKAGRTEAGSRAAAAHTGAVTGNDALCDAVLAQLGILRVDDYKELYETAMLLHRGRRPAGRRIASTSISGGNLVALADVSASIGMEWPAFSSTTQTRLTELLPGFGMAANPTDLTSAAIGQPGLLAAATTAILNDPAVDVLIPIVTNVGSANIRALVELSANSTKPVAMLWIGHASDESDLTPESLIASGHAVYRDAIACVKAVWAAMRYSEFRARLAAPPAKRPDGIDTATARRLITALTGTPNGKEISALLQCYGVSPSDAADARSPNAPEMCIGIMHDAIFGPVVTITPGGAYAALLKDIAFRLPPFAPDEALEALRNLRGFGLLAGTQGRPSSDVAALTDLIARISWLATDLQDFDFQLEIDAQVLRQGNGVRIIAIQIAPQRSHGKS